MEISRRADPGPGNLLHRNHLIICFEMLGECFDDIGREGGREGGTKEGMEAERDSVERGLTGV